MNISLSLIDNNSIIYKKILESLISEVKDYMVSKINTIKIQLPPIIRQSIISTPEYTSLINGKLKYEFGIPDSGSKLTGILDIWSNNININYKPPKISNNQIKSMFSINMIKVNFSDVLYSDYAIVYDSLRGYSLPWLEWLLLEGNKTIVPNHEVVFGPHKQSRSGMAIMKESNKSWSVPSQFTGTINDNWITRAIDNSSNDIDNLLNKVFMS